MEKLKRGKYNKYIWTDEAIAYLVANGQTMKADDLAKVFGTERTAVRKKLYEMGIYKMKLEYWTKEQVEYLKTNYQQKGDTELAKEFSIKWQKEKGWSKKHIEKKRRYLKLKRADEHKKNIRKGHQLAGVFKESLRLRWLEKASPDGSFRLWNMRDRKMLFIKVNGRFEHWGQWYYKTNIGEIPPSHMVIYKNGDGTKPDPTNLKLISRAENAIINKGKSTIEELAEIERILNQINTIIHEKQNDRPQKPSVCYP